MRSRRGSALVLWAAVVLALASLAVVVQHDASSPDLLAGGGSDIGAATERHKAALGDEPIAVVATGDMETLLTSGSLLALMRFEGRAAKLPGVRMVFGPATFVNQTIIQFETVLRRTLGTVADRAAVSARRTRERALAGGARPAEARRRGEAARLRTLEPVRAEYSEIFVRYGYIGLPSLQNREFVHALVKGRGTTPKRRLAWLFPDNRHAVVYVRLRGGLSDAAVRGLGRRLQSLADETAVPGVRLRVAGAPLVAAALSESARDELTRLAPLAALAMVLVLLLGFRARAPRLHLLVPALLASAMTAGAGVALGLGVTLATVAALPVVIGLTVDYAVQLQARYWRERASAPAGAAAAAAVRGCARLLVPAAAAMSLGFLALVASSVPVVSRLGLTLVIGTVVGLGTVLAVGGVLLVLRDGRGIVPEVRVPQLRGRRAPAVLTVCAVVAAVGLVLSSQAPIESDLARLADRSQPELRAVQAVQAELRTSGQLRVSVRGVDVTDPVVLEWMRSAQQRIVALDDRLAPGPNLGELLLTGATRPTRADVRALLGVVPSYLVDAVMTRDARTAEMSVGVPLLPVAEQARLVRRVAAILAGAPPGVEAAPAGLLASAAASVDALHDERLPILALALGAILFVLSVLLRSPLRALVCVAPALLAAGVCGLVIGIAGIKLTPLSVGLETLVLAVGVEFGVLLEGRFRELRAAGMDVGAAARRTQASIGAAVIASAGTVAAGFLVLGFSRLEVLRQFGLLVALELALCVVASVVIVPALAALTDGRRIGLPGARTRAAAGATARRRSELPNGGLG